SRAIARFTSPLPSSHACAPTPKPKSPTAHLTTSAPSRIAAIARGLRLSPAHPRAPAASHASPLPADRSPARQPRPGVTPPNANASQSTPATRPPTELPRTSSCSVHPRASWADARPSPISRSPSPFSPAIATVGSGHGSQPSNLAQPSAGIHHPLSTHRNPRLLPSFLRARLFFVQGLHQQHDSLVFAL
ncbi:Unknown protein, partial [Striga hermonthica]